MELGYSDIEDQYLETSVGFMKNCSEMKQSILDLNLSQFQCRRSAVPNPRPIIPISLCQTVS